LATAKARFQIGSSTKHSSNMDVGGCEACLGKRPMGRITLLCEYFKNTVEGGNRSLQHIGVLLPVAQFG
jgi:hypothetical protein